MSLKPLTSVLYYVVRAREPASFWRENAMAFTIIQPDLTRSHSDGNKFGKGPNFFINNRVNFSDEKSEMKLSRMHNNKSNFVLIVVLVLKA